MGIYADCVLPRLFHWAMRGNLFDDYRRRICASAQGRVLEIGVGSALNARFYGSETRILGIDPAVAGLRIAQRQGSRVHFSAALSEALPFADDSFDHAVSSWTLCSVGDPYQALNEIRRVVRPGGALHFVEHGLAPDGFVRAQQSLLNPLQNMLCGGCHLNRPIDRLLTEAGFRLEGLTTRYEGFPRFATFMYSGRALV